ncbi:MAG: hypothetical protein WAK27_22220 [Candidatus Sulfotelmatobacter sp.]
MTDFPENYDQFSSLEKIEWEFPALRGGVGYRDTSDETAAYNCLAWALGINWTRYDPEPKCAGYYWFPGLPRKWDEVTLRLLFEKHNYSVSDNSEVEPGYEKVVFYSDDEGVPQHFARQLPNGKWTSKVGDLNDIEHDSLDCLISPIYGAPGLVLKRKLQGV